MVQSGRTLVTFVSHSPLNFGQEYTRMRGEHAANGEECNTTASRVRHDSEAIEKSDANVLNSLKHSRRSREQRRMQKNMIRV